MFNFLCGPTAVGPLLLDSYCFLCWYLICCSEHPANLEGLKHHYATCHNVLYKEQSYFETQWIEAVTNCIKLKCML